MGNTQFAVGHDVTSVFVQAASPRALRGMQSRRKEKVRGTCGKTCQKRNQRWGKNAAAGDLDGGALRDHAADLLPAELVAVTGLHAAGARRAAGKRWGPDERTPRKKRSARCKGAHQDLHDVHWGQHANGAGAATTEGAGVAGIALQALLVCEKQWSSQAAIGNESTSRRRAPR